MQILGSEYMKVLLIEVRGSGKSPRGVGMVKSDPGRADTQVRPYNMTTTHVGADLRVRPIFITDGENDGVTP